MDLSLFFDSVDIGIVVAVLVLLQLVRETLAAKNIEVHKMIWRWGSAVSGALASLIVPLANGGIGDWRQFASRALVYAAAVALAYNLIKDPTAYLRKRFGKDDAVVGKRLR